MPKLFANMDKEFAKSKKMMSKQYTKQKPTMKKTRKDTFDSIFGKK